MDVHRNFTQYGIIDPGLNNRLYYIKCPYLENLKVANDCPNLLAKVPKQHYVLQNSDLERNTLRPAMVNVKLWPFWSGLMELDHLQPTQRHLKKLLEEFLLAKIILTKFFRHYYSKLLTILFCQIDVEISKATLIPCTKQSSILSKFTMYMHNKEFHNSVLHI